MVCEAKFGATILPAYSPLDIKVKQQLQQGENAGLYVIEFQYDRNIAETLSKQSFILHRVSQNIF